ncbi:MAG TPA: amidohydrolase, partial [Gammaproteobacteria bacterium]|nr:amidohydrolase [Gammaproteobacteria bacterium]
MIRATLILAAALIVSAASAETRIVDLREGTNISVALAPNGRFLVTDLLGRLWRLPANGGGAEPLTPEQEGARYPRFSHDGRYVVYQRLIHGQWDLWLLEIADGTRRELVGGPYNELEPDF